MRFKSIYRLYVPIISILLFFLIALIMTIDVGEKKTSIHMAVFLKSDLNQYKDFVDEVKKHKNISIELDYIVDDDQNSGKDDLWESVQRDLNNKLNDKNIDLIAGVPTQYYENIIKNNQLVELDQQIEEDKFHFDNLYQPAIDLSKKVGNGHHYFLSPMFSTKLLIINKDLLNEYKISIPNQVIDWKEFESTAATLEERTVDRSEKIYPLSLGPGGEKGLFMDFQLITTPAELPLQVDGTIYPTKEWEKLFIQFMNMYKKYGVHDFLEDRAFYSGRIGLRVTYPHELDFLYNKDLGSKVLGFPIKDFQFTVLPIPTFTGKDDIANIETHNIAISNQSEKKRLAWEVVKFSVSKEYAVHVAEGGGSSFGGNFPTYVDGDVIQTYQNKYPGIDIKHVFYYGKQAPYIKESFANEKEYYLFHELEKKYFPLILDNQLSVIEGFQAMQDEYRKKRNGVQ